MTGLPASTSLASQNWPAPAPGAAPMSKMIGAQAALELRTLTRNGEQLLLTLIIPVLLLVAFGHEAWISVGHGSRIDFVVPGILALAVMSTAFTSQAIATGFERRYGVLKRLGAAPLSRAGLIAAKTVTVLTVELAQAAIVLAVGVLLGWAPYASRAAALWVPLLLLAGTAAFSGLALLLAGTLRAEATLAAANLIYLVMLGLGGVLVPARQVPTGGAVGAETAATRRTVGRPPVSSCARWRLSGPRPAGAVRMGGSCHRPGRQDLPLGVTASRSPLDAIPPSVLVFSGIVSVQAGAGLAGRMFSQLGPAGVTGLRLWWAALIIAVLAGRGVGRTVRQAIADRAWRDLAVAVAFGLVLGLMNFSIYQSFARIPLGVAVTIEFLGPLTVAVVSSRRLVDLAWVVMAAGGVLLLTNGGATLAAGAATHAAGGLLGLSTQATGIGFGLVAAACWAGYILLSRATGRRFSGSSGLVIAMIVAAILVTGPAIAQAGGALLHPAALAEGMAIGLLSSVIPYRFELEALRRIPAGTFGIWMSLEPAVAALAGLILLAESLVARQWLAIGLVVIACAGAARDSAGRDQPAPDTPAPPGG